MIFGRQRAAWIVGVALFASYAYFYQAGGWNQNSRFALVRAILDSGTLRIDDYRDHTGDRALFEGHYYSDKAPGASLLALAPAVIGRATGRLVHVHPRSSEGVAWASYVATVLTSGLFTIVAALLVMQLSLRWGSSRGAATFAATAYGIATPAWCYATLFMGHAVTAGCLMLGFAAAVDLCDTRRGRSVGWGAGLVGFWTGLAVLTEFPAAIPTFFIVLLALSAERVRRFGAWLPALAGIAAGGAIPAAVLFGYNILAFHHPLHLGYSSEEGFEQMRTGYFGIAYPVWWRVKAILVGDFRGILPLAPLLAMAPAGMALSARTRARMTPMLVAGAIVVFYVLFNASYYYWEGGWSYGPRHIVPALPFLCLGLAPLWDRGGTAVRAVLALGWLWGMALTLVAVSTTPQPPVIYQAPVRELLWPAFKEGDLSLNHQSFVDARANGDELRGHTRPHAAWNLGEIAGLHGLLSLAPLAAIWCVAGVLLARGRNDFEPGMS